MSGGVGAILRQHMPRPETVAGDGHLAVARREFARGFHLAVDAADALEVVSRLAEVPVAHRGFASEGCAMAWASRAALGGAANLEVLFAGIPPPYVDLAAVGVGFAAARLGRDHRSPPVGLAPAQVASFEDGYGFCRGIFETHRYLSNARFPFLSVDVDRGVGRGAWFACEHGVARMAKALRGFEASRQPALWTGLGVAAAYTGGLDDGGLADLRDRAGDHAAELSAGVRVATTLREASGYVPRHTLLAARILG